MLIESFASFARSMKERITKPFFGAFAIAWLLWNWKFLYIIFQSNMGVTETLDLLQAHIDYCNSLLYPIVSATLYLMIMPWIDLGIMRAQRIPSEMRHNEEYESQIRLLQGLVEQSLGFVRKEWVDGVPAPFLMERSDGDDC